MAGVPAKPLEWARAALDQLEEQIEYVAEKGLADPIRVGERIERALDLIGRTRGSEPPAGAPGHANGRSADHPLPSSIASSAPAS